VSDSTPDIGEIARRGMALVADALYDSEAFIDDALLDQVGPYEAIYLAGLMAGAIELVAEVTGGTAEGYLRTMALDLEHRLAEGDQ
jgi:hypothetical protein